MERSWTSHLVDREGNVTLEFGLVCALLVLLAWVGVAMQGATAHTTGAVDRCAHCRRATMFQRRPGAWVPIVAGLAWGALLWADVPSLVRWFAPVSVWAGLVALHPKRCALCRRPLAVG